jgi:hypothetical protein
VRALLGLALLSGGCDLLFQIDHLSAADAGTAIDADTGMPTIELTARGKMGAGLATQTLTLDFGPSQPAQSDFTVAAVCYNHTNLAMVASIKDAQGHALTHVLTSTTTNEYMELWAGHIASDLTLTLTMPADFPDIRAVAYRGVDPVGSSMTVEGKVMGGTVVHAGPLQLPDGHYMVVAADCVQNQTTSLPDFVQEVDANGNWIADRLVTGPGDVSAMASQQLVGDAILLLAALHAAE